MIGGIYTPGVKTISGAGTWIPSNSVASQMPVCLILASTKTTYKVEVSTDAAATGWTTLADVAGNGGGTAIDWMLYVTEKNQQVKTTGTGFLRVQGDLVAKV